MASAAMSRRDPSAAVYSSDVSPPSATPAEWDMSTFASSVPRYLSTRVRTAARPTCPVWNVGTGWQYWPRLFGSVRMARPSA